MREREKKADKTSNFGIIDDYLNRGKWRSESRGKMHMVFRL